MVFGSVLSNATLRYKTVPGYSWLAALLLKDRAPGAAPKVCTEGWAGDFKTLSFERRVLKALEFRYCGALSSYWSPQHTNKAGTKFPPKLEVSYESFRRNLVAATWLKAAGRRNVQAERPQPWAWL